MSFTQKLLTKMRLIGKPYFLIHSFLLLLLLINLILNLHRIFLVDLLNFSFWSDLEKEKGSNCQEKFSIYYKDKRYTGYWSLCAAINRGTCLFNLISKKTYSLITKLLLAIDEEIPITT